MVGLYLLHPYFTVNKVQWQFGFTRWFSGKYPPATAGDMGSLVQADSLDKEMVTHSSILAWKSHVPSRLLSYSPWGRKELNVT